MKFNFNRRTRRKQPKYEYLYENEKQFRDCKKFFLKTCLLWSVSKLRAQNFANHVGNTHSSKVHANRFMENIPPSGSGHVCHLRAMRV